MATRADTNTDVEISVLLPTRGRTQTLENSVLSLLENCQNPDSVELLLLFDDDDTESSSWFTNNLAEKVDSLGGRFTCWQTPRLGYVRLNEYVNFLAGKASGAWLMFWNDDAVMRTADWDAEIRKYHGKFLCLRMPTHREHPYAIFPIIPRAWYELFGYISPHQISDAWVSQIAYLLDIMQTIPVSVEHDRHDLTGNNKDQTFLERRMLEGRPSDPRDFNHSTWRKLRLSNAHSIYEMLQKQGVDMSWYQAVLRGEQEAWSKMCSDEFDPNHQVSRQTLDNRS